MTTVHTPPVRFATKSAVLLAMVAAILATFGTRPAHASQQFNDVPPSHAFYNQINWMKTAGISTGYAAPGGGFNYAPSNYVLREQMAVFLYRLAGEPVVVLPTTSPFSDVAATHTFYTAIVWMDQTGISTGYAVPGGREFQPGQPVLRDAMAAFLYRYKGSPAHSPQVVSPFTDVSTAHIFYHHIDWLAATGISTGYPDGTFQPNQPVLRDAMAAFLFRLSSL